MWKRASLLAWKSSAQLEAVPKKAGSVARRYPLVASFVQQHRLFASSAESFDDAKEKMNTLKEDPGPTVKLKLYGLFKQVKCFLVFAN